MVSSVFDFYLTRCRQRNGLCEKGPRRRRPHKGRPGSHGCDTPYSKIRAPITRKPFGHDLTPGAKITETDGRREINSSRLIESKTVLDVTGPYGKTRPVYAVLYVATEPVNAKRAQNVYEAPCTKRTTKRQCRSGETIIVRKYIKKKNFCFFL